MKNKEKMDFLQGGRKNRGAGGERMDKGTLRIFEVFLQNQAPLRRFISRFLVPAHEIDDIAQEAFLRAYESEKRRRIDNPKAFLFRIAKNLMLSEFSRKSHKLTDYLEDFENGESLMETAPLEDRVLAQQKIGILCEGVATLPPQCRKVFLLKKVYGMSHKEIADYLGISVSTIEKHLVKGMRQCNAVIAERYGSDLADVGKAGSSPVRAASNTGD